MSGLSPTVVLRYLNRNLGKIKQVFPELNEDQMMRVVFQESLVTYSKYFPYMYKLLVTEKDSIKDEFDNRPNVYKIPNNDHLEIWDVHRLWIDNVHQYGATQIPLINDPIQSQLLSDSLSMYVQRTTFHFEAPDLITIRPRLVDRVSALLEVKAVHPKHLRTIPLGMRDQFLRLCLDDVLISLYPLRHKYESLSTPFGGIQLFLEQVDNAANDRNELLESWARNQLSDSQIKRIWIA